MIWFYGARGGAEMGCNGDTNQVSNILEGVPEFLGGLRSRGKTTASGFLPRTPTFPAFGRENGVQWSYSFSAWSAPSEGGTSALLNYSGPRRQPAADLRGP